jgi:hypothetical protein
MAKSKFREIEVGNIRVKNNAVIDGTVSYGVTTWASATTFNGAVTFNSTTTIAGPLVLTNATLPATYTATGVAGTIVLRPSISAVLICMSTNSWYRLQASLTALN